MSVTPEDVALLEWTRRRMLARACWVAAATTVAPAALLGGWGLALGGLIGLGAFRAARGAYVHDVERLVVDRLLRRRDPAWRLDPEGAGDVLFSAEGPDGARLVARRAAWTGADGRAVERPPEPRPSLFRPVPRDLLDRQAGDLARLLD